MKIDSYQLAVVAYGITVVLALIAEFAPWRRIARPAALAALASALIGGASWCWMVYQRGYIFEPYHHVQTARKGGGGSSQLSGGGGGGGGGNTVHRFARQGGGDMEIKEEEATGGGELGTGDLEAQSESVGSSNLENIIETLIPSRKKSAPDASRPRELAGDIVIDCTGCPEMVIVAGGTSLAGAPDSDLNASVAERPQHTVRIWPGFALSRLPISAEAFDAFRLEVSVPPRTCEGPAPDRRQNAVCLTARDAEEYAAWLTRRTGKRFRLPTAIEWEFAARTQGQTVLATVLAAAGSTPIAAPLDGIGRELAEMTADCYDPYLPSAGRARYAWETNPLLCEERVVKGGGVGEPSYLQRPSARRPWNATAPRWTIGFRVMRPVF